MHEDSIEDLPDMWKAVYDLVAQVPRGMVTTYGQVALALGDIAASRFVGLAMSRNDDIVRVPCRRVVQTDARLGGYTGGGPRKKAQLLRREGIGICDGSVVGLEQILFKDFKTSRPLANLRKRQEHLRRRLILSPYRKRIDRVAGMDVAYKDGHAWAARVIMDFKTGKEVERCVVEGEAEFPYIPTYLAFRELPLVGPLVRDLDEHTVVMYDGNGILHPLRFGITSQLGVAYGVPSVGVAKKLLCGKLGRSLGKGVREIELNGELLGHALVKPGQKRPVFVSAGHMVSATQSLRIAQRFLEHRVPEPVRQAHLAAEAARRGRTNK